MNAKQEWYLCGVLALAAIGSFFITSGPAQADGFVHVYFLDVGQGDAMLVQGPDGTQVLIDGGPGRRVIQALTSVIPLTDRSIDVVIATHTDADHLTGLVGVLEQYDVAQIIETGMACSTATCASWEKTATQEHASRSFAYEGYRLAMGGDVVLTILNPPQSVHGQNLSKTNNGGIVARLEYGAQSVLFTADVESSVERALLGSGAVLDSDFLKIGHHGSKTSSTQEFLDAVTPQAVFIEVGATNRYGHPTMQVLDRLAQKAIPVYRTDIDGTIELILDGTHYQILKNKP